MKIKFDKMILERSSELLKLQQILNELQTAVSLVLDEQLMNLKRKWSSEPSTATLTFQIFTDFQQKTTKNFQRQIYNTRSAPEFLMNLLSFTNIPFDRTFPKFVKNITLSVNESKQGCQWLIFFGKNKKDVRCLWIVGIPCDGQAIRNCFESNKNLT